MFKLSHNCTHLTHQQSKAQNSPSEASTVCDLRTFRCTCWIQERQRNQKSNCQQTLDYRKSKRVSEKHLLLLYWLCQSHCVDHNTLWKILEEMGIPDHLTCLLRNLQIKKQQNWTWNNRLVPNLEMSTLRLYIVTLLI